MKIKVWTMTTDTDDGLQTEVFTAEKARNHAIFQWLSEGDVEGRTAEQLADHFKGDLVHAYEGTKNGEDFLNFGDQEIEVETPPLSPLHVKIEVSGGVAEVAECPEGVTVEIIDYDNERNG